MSDKSLRQFSEDIEQRRLALKQRSADAVSRYKERSATSGDAAAKRRVELSQKSKQAVADMIAKRKSDEQKRADARAAQQEKQDMKDSIKKELEAERAEKKDDNEEQRKSRERKRMEKEKAQEKKRESLQQTMDAVG